MEKKNIKIVSLVWHKFLPANFGGQQTIAAFNNALANEVNFICLCSKNNIAPNNNNYTVHNILPTTKWQFINPIVWIKIIAFCKKHKANYLLVEHCYYAMVAWLVHKLLGIKIIHSSHNIEYERFRQLNKPIWKVLLFIEKWISQFAFINLFVTQQDKELAIKKFNLNINHCLVLPHTITQKNIVDKQFARQKILNRHHINSSTSIFLFNGTLDYLPNAKAVENIYQYLITELNKLHQNFIFIINGRIENKNYNYLLNLANEKVIFTGAVNDIDDYFLAADVFVNAVNFGGGVQTKTLQALSFNLNVVCFSNMLDGIETNLVHNKIFIANNNNWQQLAIKTIEASKTNTLTSTEFFNYYSYAKQLPALLNII